MLLCGSQSKGARSSLHGENSFQKGKQAMSAYLEEAEVESNCTLL